MLDGIEVSSDVAPIVELVGRMYSEGGRADRFAHLRSRQAKCLAATEQYEKELERLYQDIANSGHTSDWILQAADVVRQKEAAHREALRPGIEELKQKLISQPDPCDAESRRLLEGAIAVGEAWLSLSANLHKKLLQLATERRAAAEKIRHARPVEGDIDHEALTREVIERFPKILAALAK
jgi:hypothetical protein